MEHVFLLGSDICLIGPFLDRKPELPNGVGVALDGDNSTSMLLLKPRWSSSANAASLDRTEELETSTDEVKVSLTVWLRGFRPNGSLRGAAKEGGLGI